MRYIAFICLIFFISCSKKVVPETPVVKSIVVVVNGDGKTVAAATSVPTEKAGQIAKFRNAPLAFTPNERKNLMLRYKMIPPRILYVPDELAKDGGRGYYYVYKTKLWYWKAADGFFHLDETYYK